MASTWRQLLPHFLAMLLIYFVLVTVLATVGVFGTDDFIPRMIVALVVAFGYPAALRYLDRAPPAWQR